MAISQQTKNYEEWKLLNERKKAKERKREREVRHYVGRGMRNAWGFIHSGRFRHFWFLEV